ncbi:helix-turn-helix domain-containing protein [Lutispora saccharofermentans]|uniref:Helix-turn-helix domain-containing protein n=1 Tax=Lutispora saccharofermentans TaxID=3024236 RepID=A0ABT1NMX4_9FIRM|nr:helix-turn-helix domain-containing protein [Lutispora saccharofermentans]MCQ1531286.1 helix-turn-helix domain-containing protein [Lutispora saccharofermentans]
MRNKTVDTIPVLTEQMYIILNSFSSSRSLPSSLVKRSKIILLASQGTTNLEIAEIIDLHYTNVATWRNRFLHRLPVLREIEISTPENLQGEIIKILTDEKRPGASHKFTPEQIMKIIDLACKNPRELGYEVS